MLRGNVSGVHRGKDLQADDDEEVACELSEATHSEQQRPGFAIICQLHAEGIVWDHGPCPAEHVVAKIEDTEVQGHRSKIGRNATNSSAQHFGRVPARMCCVDPEILLEAGLECIAS